MHVHVSCGCLHGNDVGMCSMSGSGWFGACICLCVMLELCAHECVSHFGTS